MTLDSTPRPLSSRPRSIGGLFSLLLCALMVHDAHSACSTSISGTGVPDRSVGGAFASPIVITIAVPVATSSATGTSCTTAPTLVGGSVHVELWYNGQIKYSGDGIIYGGPGTLTQTVYVPVTVNPWPSTANTYDVRHSGIAYFSDGSVRLYGPVTLLMEGKEKADKSSNPAPAPEK